jgi:hypothetical protein
MNANIVNREYLLDALRRELVGPSPAGDPLLTFNFRQQEDAWGPFVDKDTGEEIITRNTPRERYGVGVLHPLGTDTSEQPKSVDGMGLNGSIDGDGLKRTGDDKWQEKLSSVSVKFSNLSSDTSYEELDLTSANTLHPSSMGVSFLAEFPDDAILVVKASGGKYKKLDVEVAGKPRTWWCRESVVLKAEFQRTTILGAKARLVRPDIVHEQNLGEINLRVELYVHPYRLVESNQKLVTVVIVNRSVESTVENTLFQAQFRAFVHSGSGQKHILPYPGPALSTLDDEELSLELLYRDQHTFGIGHGCAAMWDYKTPGQKTEWIATESLPAVETHSTTPDITDETGKELKVPMAVLAGLVDGEDGFNLLEKLVTSYEKWIRKKEVESASLEPTLKLAADRNLQDCKYCAVRMRNGIQFLRSNPVALKAFRWANRALLSQQLHARPQARRWSFDTKSHRGVYPDLYEKPDIKAVGGKKGYWRAFQIAFILATVESATNPQSPERDIVELIWFPTGGGKTEAYLGLAAYSLFLRRLEDQSDNGVHVLMRYTLRLLTTQQFLRASRMMCALEEIRKENIQDLGVHEFSIGLWVGSNNTPNSRQEALASFSKLQKGEKFAENPFVLDRCPWCNAQMGPLDEEQSEKSKIYVLGYYRKGKSIAYKCPDKSCEFSSGLPIYVTDEEMYESPPSMIIGTVDKFAMLAWKPDARALFGLDVNGVRVKSPPGLIIQDELHLISGPLGSVVGLYEVLIEELCTDRRSVTIVKPKILSSTATIRRYQDQIKALYGRETACLFPPPGIEAGDSFFSQYARTSDGIAEPGRMYVGVHAPGLGSMQTVQVRTFTTLLQAPMDISDQERDPWWTLLLFFNSLRELGTTLSLLQSDIPDYLQVYINRLPKSKKSWRNFADVIELTGRTSSQDVPKAIATLEKSYPGKSDQAPVDVCLASNILEVGVDIERLSLMAIVGQPKTTSQYIQVTGRVGRNWRERSGLVVTLYSATKPRDKSHFEKFLSYHQKLYAQVEPTSVTPFSAPVLDRALHAVMIGFVRQFGESSSKPHPYPESLIEQLKALLLPRIQTIDPGEIRTFEKIFTKRSKQWKTVMPIYWQKERGSEDIPLMREAGSFSDTTNNELPFPTMQSMRAVDAECVTEIRLPDEINSFMEGEEDA